MTVRRLEDLQPDMELEGVVTRTELYGAFVDVGADKDGLVHISMLQKGNVKRVEDVVQTGQQVQVWVHRVDAGAGRLELSMLRPVATKWKDIKPGLTLQGKVVRLEGFGAFVDVGAERPGLVHISEMSNDYVRSPGDVVSVGDEVEVRVLDVDRKKRQIKLSMKSVEVMEEIEEDEPVEELPTAMELALRQAMGEGAEADANNHQEGGKRGVNRDEQEDILSRTLSHRVNTQATKKEE
ncbi:MAG TPA: S1 RNA-binding domain-containing protein [Anaerolineales bacterium]